MVLALKRMFIIEESLVLVISKTLENWQFSQKKL
jgi:hypothetical protein